MNIVTEKKFAAGLSIAATMIAIMESKTTKPVILIRIKPINTPRDENISVLKCSASAKSDTESDLCAT